MTELQSLVPEPPAEEGKNHTVVKINGLEAELFLSDGLFFADYVSFMECNFQKHLGVSKNTGGPPKWMVKIMENLFGGPPLFLETPTLKKISAEKGSRMGKLELMRLNQSTHQSCVYDTELI